MFMEIAHGIPFFFGGGGGFAVKYDFLTSNCIRQEYKLYNT